MLFQEKNDEIMRNMKNLAELKLVPSGDVVVASQSVEILHNLIRCKVPISHSCGGHASCGTCRIVILEGLNNASERTEPELEMAQERGLQANERLACQTFALGPMSFEIKNKKPLS